MKYVAVNDIKFLSVVQTKEVKVLFKRLKLKMWHMIASKANKMYTIIYQASEDTYDKDLKEAEKIVHSFKFVETKAQQPHL